MASNLEIDAAEFSAIVAHALIVPYKDGALNKFIIVLDFVLKKCVNIACPKDVDLNNVYAP